MTILGNRLLSSGALTALRTMRINDAARAAERRLVTHFWFAVSVSKTNLFLASTTCKGAPITAERMRSCSLVSGVMGAVLAFTCCFSDSI